MKAFIYTDLYRQFIDEQTLDGLSISINESDSGIIISITNNGSKPVGLVSAGLLMSASGDEFNEKSVIFIDSGKCAWAGVRKLSDPTYSKAMDVANEQRMAEEETHKGGFHRSSLQTVLYNHDNESAILIGFLGQNTGHGWVDVYPPVNPGEVISIEAWQEIGREIEPGEQISLDCISVGQGQDPYSLLEEFADKVSTGIRRNFNGPPVVGMMTWYGYHAAVTEDIVIENAGIIGDFFDGYPQEMQKIMLLDHGWQNEAEWGDTEADPVRFSHGLLWLAKRLSGLGLELGIWHTPFCITEHTKNYKELEPLMAKDQKGEKKEGLATVWSTFDFKNRGKSRKLNYFDASDELVRRRWKKEMKDFADIGCSYCKVDFFVLEKDEQKGRNYSMGELYNLSWKSFREGFGDDRHIAPCSCDTNMQLGHCDSVRIASDIGEAGSWPGAYEKYRYGHSTIAALWYKNIKFWVNDPDSLQVGKGCSLGEARIRATTVALAGGHVMLSEDLRLMSPERLELVRRILPPIKKSARPYNLFENPFPDGYPSVWRLDSKWQAGPGITLALFNFERKTKQFHIEPQMLEIDNDHEFIVLEWWQGRWLGRFNDSFHVDVPPEDCAVLHAVPVHDYPCVVSVSHHITGGYILDKVKFNANTKTLSGEIHSKPGIDMVIYGYLPSGWEIPAAERGHTILNSLGGWQSEIRTVSTVTTFSLKFERGI